MTDVTVFHDTFAGSAGTLRGHVADVGTNNANGASTVVWGCVYDDVVLNGAGEVTTDIIENLTDHGHATCAFDCGELTHNSTFFFEATFPVVVSDNTYRSLTVGIFFNDDTNNEHYWAEIYITGRPGYGNCRLTGNGTSINDGELRAMDTAQHTYTLTFDMDGGWVYLDQDLSPETGSMGGASARCVPTPGVKYTHGYLDLQWRVEYPDSNGPPSINTMSVTVVPGDPPPDPGPGGGNRLIKNTIVHYTPGMSGTPAVPPQPARVVAVGEQVCKFVPVDSIAHGGGSAGSDISGGTSGNTGTIYLCTMQNVTKTIPATPGHPGTPSVAPSTTVDYQLGWNAGARSRAFFTGDGFGEFKVRASAVGVICGLNIDDTVDAKYIGVNIDYAFYCGRGVARIQENGVFVTSAGLYTDATVFRIERTGTSVVYKKDGATIHTTTAGSTPALFMEAALYSGDDEVFDPVLTQVSAPDLTQQTGQINITLPPLGLRMTQGNKAEINITLPPMGVAMSQGLAQPSFALLALTLPRPQPKINWFTGQRGDINVVLPPMGLLLADHAYSVMSIVLPVPHASMLAYEGNTNASMSATLGVSAPIAASNKVLVRMDSRMQLSDAMTFHGVVSAQMVSTMGFAVSFDLQGVLHAIMNSSVALGWMYHNDGTGSPGAEDDGSETWAVNLETSGSMKYDNYGFNSFAMFNGRYYGARDDGLSLLEGDTDAGELIRANVDFGVLDFGNQQKVTVEECFVGMSGKGNLFLKVTANGAEYIYKTQNFTDKLQQQRIKPGKGLRTNYVHLELYNEEGADFEIDTVRFMVVDLSRKL